MIQVFIMPKRMNPVHASTGGGDYSVCGDCKLRTKLVNGKLKRACYVTPFQAPLAVYKAWQRGRYPKVHGLEAIGERHRGLAVRLGAWGDPAAVPFEVIKAIVSKTDAFTGYTHQWRTCDQRLKRLVMASVDSEEEFLKAKKMGWRTFRARAASDPVTASEITCPAAPEAGIRTTCHDCTLCNGIHPYQRAGIRHADLRKDITIVAHGQGKAMFTGRLLPMLST